MLSIKKLFRNTLVILLSVGVLGAVADTAIARTIGSHFHAAYQRITTDCLEHKGCTKIKLVRSANSGGICSMWYFTYAAKGYPVIHRTVSVSDYPYLCIGDNADLHTTDRA